MLDLTGCVLSTDIAAVKTAYFQTLQKISGSMADGDDEHVDMSETTLIGGAGRAAITFEGESVS